MGSTCQFIYDTLSDPDKVQAWAAAGSFLITGGMAIFAIKTINNWKKTPIHDYISQCIEHLDESNNAVQILRNNFYKYVPENEKMEIKLNKQLNYPYELTKRSLAYKLKDYNSILQLTKKISLKSGIIKPQNPLRKYYSYLSDIIINIEIKHKGYLMAYESEIYYYKELAIIRKNLGRELPKDDENIKQIKEDLQNVLKYKKEHEKELFIALKGEDTISIHIKKLHNEAKKYAKTYEI